MRNVFWQTDIYLIKGKKALTDSEPDGAIPVAEAYEPIYKYYPDSAEPVKVGQYLVFPRNLELIMVIK